MPRDVHHLRGNNMIKQYSLFAVLLFLTSTISKAEVLIHHFGQKQKREIKVQKLNGMNVNDECIKSKSECLSLLSISKKNEKDKSPKIPDSLVKHPVGNPASDFCEAHNGNSAILHDQKNNEYDYCLMKGKYFVDSWDFYNVNNK